MKNAITEITAGPVALNVWIHSVGRTPITAWRWRKLGWLDVINIAGRPYVTPEAIARFNRRAAAGEFAREPRQIVRS